MHEDALLAQRECGKIEKDFVTLQTLANSLSFFLV